jgi:serine/threonine protein kinase
MDGSAPPTAQQAPWRASARYRGYVLGLLVVVGVVGWVDRNVFAAGIVLFELACARPLFNAKGKEALEMVKSGALPQPRDHAPEMPETLERIILRALSFHRDDRYQTARDLQHDLSRFQLEWATA